MNRSTGTSVDTTDAAPDIAAGSTDQTVRLTQAAWALVGVSLIWWTYALVQGVDSFSWLAIVLIAGTIMGLAVIASAWMSSDGSPNAIVGWLTVLLSLAVLGIWCWLKIRASPAYGTDELAFGQYAASLLVHGHDPYAHTMAPSLSQFHVIVGTHRLDGSLETALSYPSMSFLVYVPFMVLGWTTQIAQVVNIAAWMLAIVLSYWLVARALKPLVVVLGLLTFFVAFAAGGVTDTLYLPLLVVAAFRWDAYPSLRGWRAWVQPVALGLALAVKQTPWPILVFLVLGLYMDARLRGEQRAGLKIAASYTARALAAFAVANLPFIAVDPRAWLDGVLAPITGNLIPSGQGWSAFSTVLGVGGGNLIVFGLLTAAAALATVVFYVLAYPQTKALAVMLPAIVFFFTARSQTNYFVMLILPAIVAACSVERPSGPGLRWRHAVWGTLRRRIAVTGSACLFVAAIIAALAWPPPLSLRIVKVYTSGSQFTVLRIAVAATNRTDQSVHPAFFLRTGGTLSDPWVVLSGPSSIHPGQQATYVIRAPNSASQQSGYGGFRVVATTTSPPAMSVSPPYLPLLFRLHIYPRSVVAPVPTGTPLVFEAQIVDIWDRPVARAGVPVVIFASSYPATYLVTSGVYVNGHLLRHSGVLGHTNASGTARFVVHATRPSPVAIIFQTHLVNSQKTTYSFSEGVPVYFVQATTTSSRHPVQRGAG